MVQSGKADSGFSLFVTPEREKFALYTEVPVHVSVMTLYTKENFEFEYNNFSDLYNKRIGTNRGYSISKEFDLAAKKGAITLVEVERTDAIAATPSSIRTYLKEEGIKNSAIGHVRSRSAYLTLSKAAKIKDKERLLEKINQTLLLMQQDGTIEKITLKYLEQHAIEE
jgi:polar amino acid transport system substrate-binding protein